MMRLSTTPTKVANPMPPMGDIRSLDAGKESHPVQGEQDAASADFQDGTHRCSVQPAHEAQHSSQHHDTGHHSVPHQRQSIQGNKSAEDARPSGQKDRNVQDYQGNRFFFHILILKIKVLATGV